MVPPLSGNDLVKLIQQVFDPQPADQALAFLVDLPDGAVMDRAAWKTRREMAAAWAKDLAGRKAKTHLASDLFFYRNVRANNADLPKSAWPHTGGPLPTSADDLDPRKQQPFDRVFKEHSILLAPTEYSATAPLKLAAKTFRFRAATMPGFNAAMIPALKLDYQEIHRRVRHLTDLLSWADGATLAFRVDEQASYALQIDLRYRKAHASSGLLREPGSAGNLPSGEAYVVPYEGEREGDPSRTSGQLPVQILDEVLIYQVEKNNAISVVGSGPQAQQEKSRLASEPGYRNLAELGLGVLSDFGITPIGEVLLDEKLGLHIAFGRSDHFGGQVGPDMFSSPEAVVHIDRVYLRSLQPRIQVEALDLQMPDGSSLALIRHDRYVVDFSKPVLK